MLADHPPPPPRALVHRTRLLDRLDHGAEGPLTVVSGPPGAGKTTLAADWARVRAAQDRAVLWHSAGAPDAVAALVEELARTQPKTGASPLVVVVDELAPPAAPERRRLPDRALSARLAELLRARAGTLRLVLCTRGESPLPLGRARLDGEVVEIGPDELAFTWEEARALLAARLPAETAHERWSEVEGWAAGLAHEPGELPDYLRRELLDRLDPARRDFLLRVSVADELTPALAEALADGSVPDAGATLERLARDHALVVPLDRHGGGYRLAPPLRDALRALLPQALPGAQAELHRLAADWHAQAGDALAATRHALAAGAPELAADLLAGAWLDLLARGRELELARLLAQLPAATLAADPELRLVADTLPSARGAVAQALDVHLEQGAGSRPSAATTLAAARLRLARLEGDVAAAAQAAAALGGDGGSAGGRGDPAALDDASAGGAGGARRAADLAAQRRRRTLALQQLGLAELTAGDGDSAAAHLEQALGAACGGGFDHLAVACLGPLCALEAQRGRLRSAQAWGEQAVALAQRSGDPQPRALLPAHGGLAVVAWLRDERCAADAQLRRAEALLDADPSPLSALVLRIPAAWLAAAGAPGDPEQELARLEAAAARAGAALPGRAGRDAATSHLPPWLTLALDEARVRLLLALGRSGEAAAAASAPHGPRRPERLLLSAHVALAREDPAEARRLAGRFLAAATADVRPVHMLEAMVVQASTSYELDTVWDALDWLERAIAAAAEERCRRPFAEGGRSISALLRVLARRGPWPPSGFVAELLGERAPSRPAGESDERLLSARERAILRYLPSPLSKREIAGELGVSANTVKTHVSAIYRKLAVGTRAEAVTRARELGLLSGGLGA